MKRKVLSLIIAVSIAITACGKAETTAKEQSIEETTNAETISQESSTTAAISVDENLFTVEITVAKEWLGSEITQESLDLNVIKNGFESATLNNDGSVTYKMTKKKHFFLEF